MAEKPINPEEFDKARDAAQGLAADMRDILFEGRDLTDEVKKLTKAMNMGNEAAAQMVSSFRTMSRLERDIGAGIVSIFDGSRKIVHVHKDLEKLSKERNKLANEYVDLTSDPSERRRALDLEAIHKRKENLANKFQKEQLKTLNIEEELLKSSSKEIEQKLKSKDLTKQQHDGLMSDKKTLKELENSIITDKLKLEEEMLDNLSEQDISNLDKIKAEKELIALIKQKLKSGDDVIDNLEAQLDILERGETSLKKGLQGSADLLKKIGLTSVAAPLEAAAEAARMMALETDDIGKQFWAAVGGAQALVGEMLLLAMLSSGLKFDEQVTNIARDFGLSHIEAKGLRREMTEIAASSGRVSIQSADIEKSIHNLAQQFGTTGNILRNDIVEEMAVLGKLTKMSAESQGNFARFANISGKSARVITLETRRAVVNAEAERGLRVDINKTLDEAGKINGQIAAQLGGNVTKIASAITVAKQFGMTLQGVAQAGAALLDFQSSISNELEAELLIGKQINLEKARLYALTGDYEGLTREINANIGDFGDFTKMNVIQQEALAKSVGMTADGLSDVLLKNENIEELAQQARDAGDDDLAKQLERRSNQEKFTDSMDKMKGIFNDIVGGPMGEMLNVIGAIAQAVASVFNGFYSIMTLGGLINDKAMSWLITIGLLYKGYQMIKTSKLAGLAVAKSGLLIEKLKLGSTVAEKTTRIATTGVMARNNGLASIGLGRQIATAAAAGVEMIAKMGSKSFGIGAVIGIALLAAATGAALGIASSMKVGDATDDGKGGFQFSPSVGGIFEADPADQVAIGPNVVDNLNSPPMVIDTKQQSSPPVTDMSEVVMGINSQNEILMGILNKPIGIDTFNQGSLNFSSRAQTIITQGTPGGTGWDNG